MTHANQAAWLPVEHEEFLAELRSLHGDVAAQRASLWINGTERRRGSWRSWCGEPLLYTLAGRRNFFRAAFSHAIGELVEKPRLGHAAAVVGELTWTCTLMADDMIDGAAEREGRVAAHIRFGRVRTSMSILFGLYVALHGLLFRPMEHTAVRLQAIALWLCFVARCIWSQRPLRRAPRDLRAFAANARSVNSLTHWSLLGPVAGSSDRRLFALLGEYADAVSVGGKMRNDLLDYCGGSTENTTVFRDFEARVVSFPIMVLLNQSLRGDDRARIHSHFLDSKAPSSLSASEVFEIFRANGTLEECLALVRRQGDMASRAIGEIESHSPRSATAAALLRAWVWHQMDLTERRVAVVGNRRRDAKAGRQGRRSELARSEVWR